MNEIEQELEGSLLTQSTNPRHRYARRGSLFHFWCPVLRADGPGTRPEMLATSAQCSVRAACGSSEALRRTEALQPACCGYTDKGVRDGSGARVPRDRSRTCP